MTSSSPNASVLRPALTLIDGVFEADMEVEVTPNGTIGAVVPKGQSPGPVMELPDCALLPGFSNAHSHAFQRAIRGRTHHRTGPQEDDFWSWRNAMYQVVEHLNPEHIKNISRFAFMEMLLAGYTTVGEFHYVHHDQNGSRYEDKNLLAKAVIEAAREVGIGITLLRVLYLHTGFDGTTPSAGQRRFMNSNMDEALEEADALSQWIKDLHDPTVQFGIAPHSVRAVHRGELAQAVEWARERNIPLHIHASEQPSEVDACRKEWGLSPIALLHEEGVLGPQTTVVHGTHIDEHDIGLLASTGTTVCVCPTTEADLGDGILPTSALVEAGIPLAIGSDSQAIIDPFQEMRCLEMHERLRAGTRVCLTGKHADSVQTTFHAATAGGAKSLGRNGSSISEGSPADLVSIDLEDPLLAGWERESLLAHIAHHGDRNLVQHVWTRGVLRIRDQAHIKAQEIHREYKQAVRLVSTE